MYKYLFILLCFTTQAYEFATWNDVPSRWENPLSITYTAVEPLKNDNPAILYAIQQWSDATDGYIKFVPTPIKGQVTISLSKKVSFYGGVTNREMNDETKFIIGATIEFGSEEAMTQELVLHEFGHALGLTHDVVKNPEDVFGTPVMAVAVCSDDKWLHKDDVDGIRELYGLSPKSVVHFEVTRIRTNLYRFIINDTPYSTVYAKDVRGLRDVPCSLRKKIDVAFKVRGYTGTYVLYPKDLNIKLRKSIKFDVVAD